MYNNHNHNHKLVKIKITIIIIIILLNKKSLSLIKISSKNLFINLHTIQKKVKFFTSVNTVLCTLHLMSHVFGAYNFFFKTLDILWNYYNNTGPQKKTLANSICLLNVAIPM